MVDIAYCKTGYRKRDTRLSLALVLVFALLILVLVVLVLIILVAVLIVIHTKRPPRDYSSFRRRGSLPRNSGFILRPEQDSRQKPRNNGGSNPPGRCFQTSGENAQKALLVHRLPDALSQGIAEACQRHRCPGSRKLRKGLIQTHSP